MHVKTVVSTAVGAVILACLFMGFSGHSKPGATAATPSTMHEEESADAPAQDQDEHQSVRIDLVQATLSDPVKVSAKAIGTPMGAITPGALICDSYDKTLALYDAYETHYGEEVQNRMTGGRSVLIQGTVASMPDPDSWGCVLVPAGSTMLYDGKRGVPLVEAKMANGDTVTGVTLPTMINYASREDAISETSSDQAQSQKPS